MIVRRARLADAAALGQLTRRVYVGDGYADPRTSPGYVAALADGERRVRQAAVFVAESAGDIVGTVTATEAGSAFSHLARPDELEVRMLAVEPAARRRGTANALMAACEHLASERGSGAVVLCTEPAMSAAQRLYEGRGYVRVTERDWAFGGLPMLVYRLSPVPVAPG